MTTANCVTAALNMAQVLSPYGPSGAYYFPRSVKKPYPDIYRIYTFLWNA